MTTNDLALIEDVEIRQPEDIAKMDDELHCPKCDGVICDVESGDSLGLLVRTALDHLAVCIAAEPGCNGVYGAEHHWLDRPESDTRECRICGTEVAG